jgi:Ca-activated chloride channel family protein
MRATRSFGAGRRPKQLRASMNRYLVAIVFILSLAIVAKAQTDSQSQSREGNPYTIDVSVDMVVLHATVQNSRGVLVSGLGKEDFQVYEDGVLQQINHFSHEDIPVTVGLVVDNSGSMRTKRSEVISAALVFARSSNSDDQVFVTSFNEHVSFGLPPDMLFTDEAAQLRVALSKIDADGMTALYDAVAAALEHLKKGNRDKKVLLVVSDGGDNASKHKLSQIVAMAGRSEAIIYAIGVFEEEDRDRNPGVLKRLAKATGGEAFLPKSLMEVVPICERIARDIRNQYTLAYVPTNQRQDGLFRSIQVKAHPSSGQRLVVRTRVGYYAPLKPQSLPAAAAPNSEAQKR